MNIKRAKKEIRNTVRAYLKKDEFGQYVIPSVNQRPILLIGPPGIGKTAIMEQVARECGIGLVAYTITHHTRQSAVGLPFIEHKDYQGKEYAVTEYTMSEIIASVYDRIEQTGIKEGILFLDEINCVSETLAPTMLQFLQKKTFGNQRVPEGWLIVTAGNPPEYNKSVRDFDVVTLDRVKKIDVTEDYDAWRSYGIERGIHSSILSYLEIRKENFYDIETTLDGRRFVTARGWEDLSRILWTYEDLAIPVDEELIIQYLQHGRIAKDFAAYYDLFNKYRNDYRINDILEGRISEKALEKLWNAPFDERISVISLVLGKLNEMFREVAEQDSYISELYESMTQLRDQLDQLDRAGENPDVQAAVDYLEKLAGERAGKLDQMKAAGLLSPEDEHIQRRAINALEQDEQLLMTSDCGSGQEAYTMLKSGFRRETAELDERTRQVSEALEYAFDFVEKAFGEDQEMVVFVTELSMSQPAVRFIKDNDCPRYYYYNRSLFAGDRQRGIMDQIRQLDQES